MAVQILRYLHFAVSLSCLLVLIASFYAYVYKIPKNRCEMTYMFQWPEYVEVPLPNETKEAFPQYGLYAYGEGNYVEKLRLGEFTGIPVLFIPGNAGSHRQVRSLASVSLTKTERTEGSNVPEFTYFSIDTAEELSGLYGGYLERQTEFAAHCVRHILSIYKNKKGFRSSTLVVVGHSMGGIVARGLFSSQNFSSSWINLIITLASPHAAPVVLLDYAMDRYYSDMSAYWSRNINQSLQHITVLSIGGGGRDVLVRSNLTVFEPALQSAVNKSINESGLMLFETLAPDVPWVWATTDHLCIAWCKQLVMTIVRALFDMTMLKGTGKTKTNQVHSNNVKVLFSRDPLVHRKVIRHHFFDRKDWKKDLKAKTAWKLKAEDEKRMQLDPWSKLASVVRYYAHVMPSVAVGYICAFLTVDHYLQETSFRERLQSGFVRVSGFGLISALFALRIKNEGDFSSALGAVGMAYGLFTATKFVAVIILTLTKRFRSQPTSPNDERVVYARLPYILLLMAVIPTKYTLSVFVVLFLCCSKIISQVLKPSVENGLSKLSILIIQTSLMLSCLTAPFAVVAYQNYRRGGTVLPHDPSLVPALLLILLNLFSRLCQLDRFKLWPIPVMVGLVTMGFSDKLYVTIYCCSVLLGICTGRFRLENWSSKVE